MKAAPSDYSSKDLMEFALAEPSLVMFYVPLWWPIALEPVARFTLMRHESIPWGSQVEWPEPFYFEDPDGTSNFVIACFYRHEHYQEMDPRIGQYAIELAHQQRIFMESEIAAHNSDEIINGGDQSVDAEIKYGRVPVPSSQTAATIVELTTPIFRDGEDPLDPLSRAFNRCLEELNVVESAYFLTTRDLRIRHTTRATCFPAIPYSIVRAKTGEIVATGLFQANHGLYFAPYDVKDLPPDEIAELAVRIGLFKKESPLIRFAELSTIARRAREVDGDYASALIWNYTAGEMLFDAFLTLMAWEEIVFQNPSPTTLGQVVSWFSGRQTLNQRIGSHYHVRLEGGWDPGDRRLPLYGWVNETSRLRNQVVHAGYVPKEAEVVRAEQVLSEVEWYIKELICDDRNRNGYPRTTLLTVTLPGLARRGLLTNKLKRLVESEEADWNESFRQFRRQINERLAQT